MKRSEGYLEVPLSDLEDNLVELGKDVQSLQRALDSKEEFYINQCTLKWTCEMPEGLITYIKSLKETGNVCSKQFLKLDLYDVERVVFLEAFKAEFPKYFK